MAFDYAYYLKNNPDVAAEYQRTGTSVGTLDQYAAWHYQNYGMGEGRPGSAPAEEKKEVNPQQTAMQNTANATSLPTGTQVTGTNIQENKNEILDSTGKTVSTPTPVTAQNVSATTAANVDAKDAATYDATQIGNNTPQAQAAQGTVNPNALVTAQQGTLSDETKQTYDNAPQGTVDKNSTVKGQYEDLMNFEAGQIPDWAKGAYTTANQAMAARGVANSTMAGQAITSALAQAALPIAQQDAQTYANMGLKNLDVKAQATLAKANALAQMDITNLNNRQQAAVVNAQTFLAMDLKNLDNQQQTNVLNMQARLQSMLSDQAAVNAAKQFNASSQNQMTQFYDNLNANISMFNAQATQQANMFNAEQNNNMAQFNEQVKAATEQFNANMALQIDQSNVQWRRQINTANTATQNATNQINAQNLLGLTTNAQNNLWQQFRDEADYAFTASENEKTRAQNLAMAAMEVAANQAMYDQQQATSWSSTLGNFGISALSNLGSLKGLFG